MTGTEKRFAIMTAKPRPNNMRPAIGRGHFLYTCSECGRTVARGAPLYKFCPYCGSKVARWDAPTYTPLDPVKRFEEEAKK